MTTFSQQYTKYIQRFLSVILFYLSLYRSQSVPICQTLHIRYIIIIIIIIYSLEFFTSALVDGFSLESEWQQVSSSLQDSSLYSGRSQ